MPRSNEALPIKDIVGSVMTGLSKDASPGGRLTQEQISRAWKKAAGALASRRSRPVSLRKGKLIVNVEDSSLLYGLTIRKREIFENLRAQLKDRIRDIQFRIGEIEHGTKAEG